MLISYFLHERWCQRRGAAARGVPWALSRSLHGSLQFQSKRSSLNLWVCHHPVACLGCSEAGFPRVANREQREQQQKWISCSCRERCAPAGNTKTLPLRFGDVLSSAAPAASVATLPFTFNVCTFLSVPLCRLKGWHRAFSLCSSLSGPATLQVCKKGISLLLALLL